MKLWQSKMGWGFAGLYLAVAVFLIYSQCSQGLCGETSLTTYLGLPWSILTMSIDVSRVVPDESQLYPVALYALGVIFPIVLNASLLYLIGLGLKRYLTPRRVYRKDGP